MNTLKPLIVAITLFGLLSITGAIGQVPRKHNSSGVITKGGNSLSFTIDYSAAVNVISQAGTSQITVQDEIRNQFTGATFDTEATVIDTVPLGVTKAVSNLTPTIISYDSLTGRVTRIKDGTGSIFVKAGTLSRRIDFPISRTTGQTVATHASFATSSLAKHVTDNVDNSIAGLTASSSTYGLFTTSNHSGATYVRNGNLWCSSYSASLTGFSVWNSNGGQQQAGTAITPRHIVFADHFIIPDGGTIRFVTTGNLVINRTLVKSKRVGLTDARIGILNADLPASITPLSVLPSSWGDYIKNIKSGIPCIIRNQFGEIGILDLNGLSSSGATYTTTTMPTLTRRAWVRFPIRGDSGGGNVMMINGSLVLISTFEGPGSGPAYHAINWASEIPAVDALAGVSTGYVPAVITLSGFQTY